MKDLMCAKCQEFFSEQKWKDNNNECPSYDCDGISFEGFYVEPKFLLSMPSLTPTVQ